MKLSEVEKYIGELRSRFGDVPLVLYDLDSSMYFTLTPKNFEAQQLNDGSVRISVGPNSYWDHEEPRPKKRPFIFEKKFALAWNIGDKLNFDLNGVRAYGKIASIGIDEVSVKLDGVEGAYITFRVCKPMEDKQ